MMLSARTGAWAKSGYTARNYVQDGLIAMWDGIENAGWGVHDPNATIWKDLAGSGYDFQIPSAGVEIKKDCIRKSIGASISTILPETSRPEFSVEIVINIINVGLESGIIWAANPSWVGGFLFYRSSQHFQFYYPWKIIINLNYSDNIGIKKSWSINWKPSAQNLFCDNSILASTKDKIDNRNILSRWFLGEYNGNNHSEVEYYCVRLYSRALTADEIAHNYEIDKARFNLPETT